MSLANHGLGVDDPPVAREVVMSIEVYRHPHSDSVYPPSRPRPAIGEAWLLAKSCQVCLGFRTNRDGYRQSDFMVVIRPESFKELAQAMVRADDYAAIHAFADALKDLPVKPLNFEHWQPEKRQ